MGKMWNIVRYFDTKLERSYLWWCLRFVPCGRGCGRSEVAGRSRERERGVIGSHIAFFSFFVCLFRWQKVYWIGITDYSFKDCSYAKQGTSIPCANPSMSNCSITFICMVRLLLYSVNQIFRDFSLKIMQRWEVVGVWGKVWGAPY